MDDDYTNLETPAIHSIYSHQDSSHHHTNSSNVIFPLLSVSISLIQSSNS